MNRLASVLHFELLLRAVLSRRYEGPPSGNSKTSLLTSDARGRILALHAEGKGPVKIGRLLDLLRKAVARD
jgi:hypothetical protein